jgi:hypothetical protein
VSEDFDIALLSVLGQLVEAREDQSDAERRLHEYRAAETPPEIPNEFEDVDAFLDYHTAGRATRTISGNSRMP